MQNFKLFDHASVLRNQLYGSGKYAYVYGSHRDKTVRTTGKGLVDGSDLLLLNHHDLPITPLHFTTNYFRQKYRHDVNKFDCILNLVTNPDTNGDILRSLMKVLKGFGGRVINRPEHVFRTQRQIVSEIMSDVPDLVVPPTIRITNRSRSAIAKSIDEHGVRFPAILREAGTHKGLLVAIINDLDGLMVKIESSKEYYLTTFLNLADSNGLYRKQRYFIIGDDIVFRHQFVSDHWNVHGADRNRFMATRPDLIEEEQRLFQEHARGMPARKRGILSAIRQRLELDFFGVDLMELPDGRLVLFEANATMRFANESFYEPMFAYTQACIEPAAAAFSRLLIGAPR